MLLENRWKNELYNFMYIIIIPINRHRFLFYDDQISVACIEKNLQRAAKIYIPRPVIKE
jgi:hypothetical protein